MARAVRKAARARPKQKPKPAPAGYSGTPLGKKLGIKPGSVVALLGAPAGFAKSRVREFGLLAGLVDYKVAAIDATWSGLCFARRRKQR